VADNKITKPAAVALTDAQNELLVLDRRADERADAAVPKNTRRAYELDLACFASWCARHSVRPTPAEPRVVRAYLEELALTGRAPEDTPSGKARGPMAYSALMRALSAICYSNQKAGHPSIWKDPLIKSTREALAITKGVAPKKQKHAISGIGIGLIFDICDKISDDVRGVRDRAMILVGWAGGGRRRSEIVAARREHFKDVEGGISWLIPRGKTDQEGRGHVVLLTPVADDRYCAVAALRKWLAVSKIERGPVFRGVDMKTGEIMDAALAPEGVAKRISHYIKLLGLDPSDFGAHSLRSGFITTAYKMGRKIPDIMESTGHRTATQVIGYIRREGLLEEAAGRGLLDEALARRAEKEKTKR
jgi:integrase